MILRLPILLVCLALAFVAPAQAVPFTYTLIADNSAAFDTFASVSLNSGGTVAFLATLDGGGGGIFSGGGGPTAPIATTGPMFTGFGAPAINDAGAVAFLANLPAGGLGIFSGNGGAPVTIATNGPVFAGFGAFPSINGAGTVAFSGLLTAGGEGVFTGSGGALSTAADTTGSFSALADPAINNGGTLAFRGLLDGGGSGIFATNGGAPVTIADTSGPLASFLTAAINAGGTVVFQASLDGGGFGIFTGSGGPTSPIADTGGPFLTLATPAINNGGAVAFQGTLDGGGFGVFLGPDPILNKVIAIGDPLFGSTVTDIVPSLYYFNDAGQVAFSALLADGRAVVVRADPVPAPATLALLIVVFGALGLTRKYWEGGRWPMARQLSSGPRGGRRFLRSCLVLTLAACSAVASLVGAPGAVAHPFVVDQANTDDPGGGVLIHSIQLSGPIGQSFTPLLPSLDVVELLTIDFGEQPNGLGATLQVDLRAASIAGAIVGTSNQVALPDDFGGATITFPNGGGVTHFDFGAAVALVPGSLYDRARGRGRRQLGSRRHPRGVRQRRRDHFWTRRAERLVVPGGSRCLVSHPRTPHARSFRRRPARHVAPAMPSGDRMWPGAWMNIDPVLGPGRRRGEVLTSAQKYRYRA